MGVARPWWKSHAPNVNNVSFDEFLSGCILNSLHGVYCIVYNEFLLENLLFYLDSSSINQVFLTNMKRREINPLFDQKFKSFKLCTGGPRIVLILLSQGLVLLEKSY